MQPKTNWNSSNGLGHGSKVNAANHLLRLCFLGLCPNWRLFPESLRWLLATQHYRRAKAMMLRIARRNQIDMATEPSGVLAGEKLGVDGNQWGGTKTMLPFLGFLYNPPPPTCWWFKARLLAAWWNEHATQRRRGSASDRVLSCCRCVGAAAATHDGIRTRV